MMSTDYQCTTCVHAWRVLRLNGELFNPYTTCPKCGNEGVAPVPPQEYGDSVCEGCGQLNPPPSVTEMGRVCIGCYAERKRATTKSEAPADGPPDHM